MSRAGLLVRSSVLALAFVGFAGGDARAQSSEDKSAAQAAFDVGKRLMVEGKFEEACPKFAESLRLDPGVGTMLFLADCYERTGRTASAWAEFREAEGLAAKQNDNREKIAHDRGNALEPKLVKLVVTVPSPQASTPGLKVTRDGEEVGQGLWGVPVPVDPGAHKIAASAPGKKEWSSSVDVGASAAGSPAQITVPALVDAPVEAGAGDARGGGDLGSPSGAERSSGTTQRVIGASMAGLGVVGVALGAVFGLQAKSKLDDSNANGNCRTSDNHCTTQGAQLRTDAKQAATVSTVGFIAGGALLVGGAVVFFTAPHGERPVSVGASFVPGVGGGVDLRARF